MQDLKPWNIFSALVHFPDGRVARFDSLKKDDISTSFLRLVKYTWRVDMRFRRLGHAASDEAKFKRASSVYRHAGGVTVKTNSLLVKLRATGGNGEKTPGGRGLSCRGGGGGDAVSECG